MVPAVSVLVAYVAEPVAREAVPRSVPLSKKLIVPVGYPVAADVTCAVNVTLTPGLTELVLAKTDVTSVAWATVRVPVVEP
jgi:hypothetical protein